MDENYSEQDYYNDINIDDVNIVGVVEKDANISDLKNCGVDLGLDKILNPYAKDFYMDNTSLLIKNDNNKKESNSDPPIPNLVQNNELNDFDDEFYQNQDQDQDQNLEQEQEQEHEQEQVHVESNNIFSLNTDKHELDENELYLGEPDIEINQNQNKKPKNLTRDQIKNLKIQLLSKLQKLEQKGLATWKQFSASDNYDDILNEYERLNDIVSREKWTNNAKGIITIGSSSIELITRSYNPFELKLEGWSESLREALDDEDEIFSELYDKYKGTFDYGPEANLMMVIVKSGVMYHYSKSYIDSIKGDDKMKKLIENDPELKQAVENAIKKDSEKNVKNVTENANKKTNSLFGAVTSLFSGGNSTIIPTKNPNSAPVKESINQKKNIEEDYKEISDMFPEDETIKKLNIDNESTMDGKQMDTKSSIRKLNKKVVKL